MTELRMSFDPSNAVEGQWIAVPANTRATSIDVTIVDTRVARFTIEVVVGEAPNERVVLREEVDRQGRTFGIRAGVEAGEWIRVRFPDGLSVQRVDVVVNLESSRAR
jgi:hypothetical protein